MYQLKVGFVSAVMKHCIEDFELRYKKFKSDQGKIFGRIADLEYIGDVMRGIGVSA